MPRSKTVYTDESIMPFGKHKGKRLKDVPTGYLKLFWNDNIEDWYNYTSSSKYVDKVMDYIQDYIDFEDVDYGEHY